MFVLAGDADSDYSSQITAYDLGTGKPRWATAIPFPRGAVRLWQPGVLLVPVELHGGARATEALDVSRGALRWRLPGDVIDATPETALLGGADVTLRLVRMADGTTVWSQPADGLASWTVAGTDRSPARIVVAGADGQVRILRPADGATQWQGYLTGGRYVPFSGGLIAAAGVVYVSQMGTGGDAVTAYDLDPPAPRWRFAGAPERPPAGPVATACGVVICFRDGAGTVGLDPGTGAVRWRADGWTDPAPTSDRRRLLATSAVRLPMTPFYLGSVVSNVLWAGYSIGLGRLGGVAFADSPVPAAAFGIALGFLLAGLHGAAKRLWPVLAPALLRRRARRVPEPELALEEAGASRK